MIKNKSSIRISLTLVMALLLGGCGNAQTQEVVSSDTIELLEPVDAANNTESPAYRDLSRSKVYSGVICPAIREYSFGEDVRLDSFALYPGDSVAGGGALAYADSEGILQQMETARNQIEALDRQQLYFLEDCEAAIADIDEELEWPYELKAILNGIENEELNHRIDLILNRRNGILRNQEQQTAIYELDRAFYEDMLTRLEQEESARELTATGSGKVAAIGNYGQGDWVAGNTQVIAVADESRKTMQCEYLSQRTINSFEEYYALVDGQRYEVTYIPYSDATYQKLTALGETLYSTFSLDDPEGNLSVGDFAVLVTISERTTQTLTLSNEALHKNGTSSFVYKLVDGASVMTPVTIGMNDGAYTEILEGLTAQDEVLLPAYTAAAADTGTTTVEKGTFSWNYTGSGYMTYPVNSFAENPVTKGTTYFTDFQVELYGHVEAGDVIANIYVEGDDILLYEKKQTLSRLNARLPELEADETSQIARMQNQIKDLEEEIAELESDYAITQIVAEHSGMVIWMEELQSGDMLQSEQRIAQIADESRCYIMVDNTDRLLNYGNTVTFEYTDREDNVCTAEGQVVTVTAAMVSADLQSDMICILPPAEAVRNMKTIREAEYGGYFTRVMFNVSAQTRVMENVPVIPRAAVTEVGGQTYVKIVNDDGTVKEQSFIAGGYNSASYWVAEGLEEGMTICLE